VSGLPSLGRGRPTDERRARHDAEIDAFCARILKIKSGLDFGVSSRGWCYLLEGGVITKGEFNAAQTLINDCRKSGALPLDICAKDDKRTADGVEEIDRTSIEDEVERVIDHVQNYAGRAHWGYEPFSFWDDLDVYVEIAVEKIDLKSLFRPVAAEFHIPIQNIGGWSDLHARADMMQRFAGWERQGKQCALLYCGDHDPGGLHISGFIRSNLADMARAVGWSPDNLIIDRFGLNFDFIERNGLTWIDNLETGGKGKCNRLDDPNHPDTSSLTFRITSGNLASERSRPTHWWFNRRPAGSSAGKRSSGMSPGRHRRIIAVKSKRLRKRSVPPSPIDSGNDPPPDARARSWAVARDPIPVRHRP
jgi:hypothetical protein